MRKMKSIKRANRKRNKMNPLRGAQYNSVQVKPKYDKVGSFIGLENVFPKYLTVNYIAPKHKKYSRWKD